MSDRTMQDELRACAQVTEHKTGLQVSGPLRAAADRIDALEAQLARAVEALVASDACPEPRGCDEAFRLTYRANGMPSVLTPEDYDACRACWRAHLEFIMDQVREQEWRERASVEIESNEETAP